MRRKLLLADDSITVQRVIELTFSDEGLDIVTVGDGVQAIDRLQRERPDIVLADLNMPGADGYAVAEHVKRGSDLVGHTRVVLLTGAFEPVDQERARFLGVDGVLAKPFEPHVAIELVRELLEQAPLAPPRVGAPSTSDWTVSPGPSTPAPPTRAPSGWGEEESAAPSASVRAAAADWAGEQARGEHGEQAQPAAAVAAGYPFEPGATPPKSSPAELDDYFRRLDEALTNAGLTASPAVRDMLAESKESAGAAAAAQASGQESARAREAGSSGTGSQVGEERQKMSGMPSTGAMNVTLVDAFSALLAAEQVAGPAAAANLEFWTPASPASAATPADADRADVVVEHSAATQAEAAHAAAPAAAPALSEACIEAIVRRVVEEMTDRIVREVVNARVVEVAERLVREEIDRIKATASDESTPTT